MTSHKDYFLKVYEELKSFVLHESKKKHELDDNRMKYLGIMMDTTCLGGKYNRGICTLDVAERMADAKKLTGEAREKLLHDAAVCGWMIELLQAHFLVEDDIMDHSKVRRGKPCWYLHPGVTTQVAINDGLILLAWATEIAHFYFESRHEMLAQILRCFHDVDLATTMGQLYDVTSMVDSKKLDPNAPHSTTTDYVEFTEFNYRRIVVYKTAYYTYWLPLQMGLIISESVKSVDAKVLHVVAMLMGEYFQVQDDVLDCYAPPEVLGKVGTDIQDCKCSWLAVTFLAHATQAQKEQFKAHYGKDNEEDIAKVKALFNEVNLKEKFEQYEKKVAHQVEVHLNALKKSAPEFANGVESLWKKTYKRSK